MHWIYFLLLLGIDVIGLVLAAFTLPGLWLMLGAAAVYALLTHGAYLGFKSLVALLALALLSEAAEFFLGGSGAKKAGASGWGIAGALLGGLVGGIFLTGFIPIPVVGTIIGICLGSFAGAFTIEVIMGKPVHQSFHIGVGAFKGRLYGIASKLAIGIVMFGITIPAAFPHHVARASRTSVTQTHK